MICQTCPHAIVDKSKSDMEMARQGYRTCELARTPIERATFFRGSKECMWPERVKNVY